MCYYKSFKRASNYLLRKQQVIKKRIKPSNGPLIQAKIKINSKLIIIPEPYCSVIVAINVPTFVTPPQYLSCWSISKLTFKTCSWFYSLLVQNRSLQFVSVFTWRKSGYTPSSVDFSVRPIQLIQITWVRLVAPRLSKTWFFATFRHMHLAFNPKYQGPKTWTDKGTRVNRMNSII